MRRQIEFYGLLVLCSILSAGTASAKGLMLRDGSAKTLTLVSKGGVLVVTQARRADRPDVPRQREIRVSISTTQAVGKPKLHIYNRYTRAVRFKVAAMKGDKLLSQSELCGHTDTDSWMVLPSATAYVLLSRFAEAGAECP